MTDPTVLVQDESRGIIRMTLNRARVRNAFDEVMIADLTAALERAAETPGARAILITGAGDAFSAGGNLNWMRRMAEASEAENKEDAMGLARLLKVLDELPVPTIALVNGPAVGGGVGLVACCDIAIASEKAVFALSEVRLGLIPATISPYVIAAIGPRAARRYFLTAERFDATKAQDLDLVHEVVSTDQMDSVAEKILKELLKGGPAALGEAKKLIADIVYREDDDALLDETAAWIARLRASPEGQEGIGAFLSKRKANWITDGETK